MIRFWDFKLTIAPPLSGAFRRLNPEGIMSAGAAGAAGAAAATVTQAIKASGVIACVEPDEFLGIIQRQPSLLVVHAVGGFFSTNYRYLTSYKGLTFYTKTSFPLDLPPGIELVQAKAIWVSGG
jgi:hypothetical protein